MNCIEMNDNEEFVDGSWLYCQEKSTSLAPWSHCEGSQRRPC